MADGEGCDGLRLDGGLMWMIMQEGRRGMGIGDRSDLENVRKLEMVVCILFYFEEGSGESEGGECSRSGIMEVRETVAMVK